MQVGVVGIGWIGSTYQGIGAALACVVGAILRGQRTILTVCTPVAQVAGGNDVSISLPHLVGGQSVQASLQLPLDEAKQSVFKASSQMVCQSIEGLDRRA